LAISPAAEVRDRRLSEWFEPTHDPFVVRLGAAASGSGRRGGAVGLHQLPEGAGNRSRVTEELRLSSRDFRKECRGAGRRMDPDAVLRW